jgi:AraC-like DNA-binding protein
MGSLPIGRLPAKCAGKALPLSSQPPQPTCITRNVREKFGNTSWAGMQRFFFSSDELPRDLSAQSRAHAWTEAMRAIGAHFDVAPLQTDRFFGSCKVITLGDIQIGHALTDVDSPVTVARPRAIVERERDARLMVLINDGEPPVTLSQNGRTLSLPRGAMATVAMDAESQSHTPTGGATLVVIAPRARIAGLTDDEHRAAAIIEVEPAAQALLARHAHSLLDVEGEMSARASFAAGEFLVSLLSLLLTDAEARRRTAAARGLPAAKLEAVREVIAKRFREPRLTAASAGEALGLSERYVQHLFQQDRSTFSGELTRCRLEAVRADLMRAGLDEPVSDIAFRAGFTDLSTFYRAFRAHYGQTPRAVRVGAMPGQLRD